eukprot:3333084-Rhodomonas_salina.3
MCIRDSNNNNNNNNHHHHHHHHHLSQPTMTVHGWRHPGISGAFLVRVGRVGHGHEARFAVPTGQPPPKPGALFRLSVFICLLSSSLSDLPDPLLCFWIRLSARACRTALDRTMRAAFPRIRVPPPASAVPQRHHQGRRPRACPRPSQVYLQAQVWALSFLASSRSGRCLETSAPMCSSKFSARLVVCCTCAMVHDAQESMTSEPDI